MSTKVGIGPALIFGAISAVTQAFDQFVEAMRSIEHEVAEDPDLLLNGPPSTRIGRLDEAAAARRPVLRWKPKQATI